MTNFIEDHKVVHCFTSSQIAANEDIFNGDPASDVINLSDWREITFIIIKNAGATGRATITVESCDDAVPTTTTAIPFRYRRITSGDTPGAWTTATASGFTTAAAADNIYEVNVKATELNDTDKYVRLQCTESVDDPVDGAITAILTGPRFAEDVPRTSLT